MLSHILFLLRKLGILRFWKNIVVPGWRALKQLGLLSIFLMLAVGAVFWAYLLQRVAFPQAGSSAGQISATVYVKTLPAHVNLQSTFTPSAATNNLSFTVTVTGPTKRSDPWLLVVQCVTPSGKAYPGAVPLWSESVTGRQNTGTVLVRSGPTKKSLNFTCYTGLAEHGQTAATVVQDRDLNLSLPVLEQNPAGESTLAGAPLYAEVKAGKYQNVAEVQALPGAPCPISSPSPSPASSSAGSSSPSAETPSPSPVATTSASPAATSTSSPEATSSPLPSAATSATPSPSAVACYMQISAGAKSVKYNFPEPSTVTTVATSEILNNVNLSNERIDSMYPQGMVTTDQVAWHGSAGLNPSLSATNLASAERQNKDAFWAGLLYGIAAALAVPYFVEFYRAWHDERSGRVKSKSRHAPVRPRSVRRRLPERRSRGLRDGSLYMRSNRTMDFRRSPRFRYRDH